MKKVRFLIWIIFISTCNTLQLLAQIEELGKVKWNGSLEQTQLISKNTGKPILILFQEIPGCQTCKGYGRQVLSHPLIVEAIESYFVPLVVYNNKSGKDKEVLDYFKEPAWNNPVVRIVDSNLKEIGERLSGNYSSYGLVAKIVACLIQKNIPIPIYLKLLEEEVLAQSSGIQKAYVGMYCFWSGEKCYAQTPGVVATKAGYMKGSEVVEISYNPKVTNIKNILDHGKEMKCADKYFNDHPGTLNTIDVTQTGKGSFTADKETKYYLYHTNFRFLPMTEMQASKINLAIAENRSPETFLSPRQIELYNKIKRQPSKKFDNLIGVSIEDAWRKLEESL